MPPGSTRSRSTSRWCSARCSLPTTSPTSKPWPNASSPFRNAMSEPPSRSPGGSPAMISTDSSLVSPSISRSCPQLPLHDHAEHQRNSEWDYLVLLLAYLLYRLLGERGFALLLAGPLILGTAAGELATVCFLVYEISFRGILTPWIVPIVQGTLILTALMVTFVAGKRAFEAIKKGKPLAEDKAVVRRFYMAWEEEDQAKREKILERILPPYYRHHDSEGGQRLDAEGIKRKVRESHDNLRKI